MGRLSTEIMPSKF